MRPATWLPPLLSVLMALPSCGNLPRSAGLQAEVLAAPTTTAEDGGTVPATQDFAVAPVTSELLDSYARWPRVGADTLDWIERVEQPVTRIIAAGDTLGITIWNTEDNGLLTAPGQRFVTLPPIRVSSSGSVFLPYIGQQRVAGMSPDHARETIEAAYLEVSPSAQVQLDLTEGRLNTVSLVAGVASPGSYPLPDSDFTVTGLLALGGGVSESLRNPQIRLQRGDVTYGTALSRILADPGLDTTLQGGDRVFVESDDRTFLSLGAAGTQAVHPFTAARMSALEAMATIGGVNAGRADLQGLLILRRYPERAVRHDGSGPPHERMIFTLDLASADGLFSAGEFAIAPGDLVYATESPVTNIRTVFGLIGSAFGLAAQVTSP